MKKSVVWTGVSLLSVLVIVIVMMISLNLPKDEPVKVQVLQPEIVTSQVEERFGLEKDWQHNGKENLYTTKLLEGELASESTGVILTDTDCEADEKGISQCHNEIALDNGRSLTVMNIHIMKNYACLKPEDKVKIVPSEDGQWMTLSKIPS